MKRNLREICVGMAAVAIVALMFIAPRFGIAQYAGQGNWGGTSSGSANAQIISLPNVTTMSNLRGVTISFIVGSGLTNEGPTQLEVNSLGFVNIDRRNGGALIQLGGGEMPAGDMVRVTYDGTQWDLETDFTGGDIVGSIKAIDYSTADPGYVLLNGACISETANPAAYAKVGTIHNTQDGCTGSNFGLADLREAVLAGLGNMGGASDPGRITSAVAGFSPLAIGNYGGSQGYATGIAQTYLKSFTFNGGANFGYTTTGSILDSGSSGTSFYQMNEISSISSGGSGTAFPTLPYTNIVAYEMKL